MDAFYLVLGLTMIYSWIHFVVLSVKKEYSKRNTYEKIVTWYAVIMLVLYIIGSI
jgi:hypothetical protein